MCVGKRSVHDETKNVYGLCIIFYNIMLLDVLYRIVCIFIIITPHSIKIFSRKLYIIIRNILWLLLKSCWNIFKYWTNTFLNRENITLKKKKNPNVCGTTSYTSTTYYVGMRNLTSPRGALVTGKPQETSIVLASGIEPLTTLVSNPLRRHKSIDMSSVLLVFKTF